MAYGLEIRELVVSYINAGGSKSRASDIFEVSERTIYYWMTRKNLAPTLKHTKGYKIDSKALKEYIKNNPDAYLREIAQEFNVSIAAISKAFSKLKISNKKNTSL